jgi:hypothetical protein
MSVTAQGYASLADKLKADIAVLEGGYSVEAALPYVNTGIILAMAGLDYSQVVEPDQSALHPQGADCNQRVEQLIDQVGQLWTNREKFRMQALTKCGNQWQRDKSIYYDEEGIRETQRETAHYCNNCSGYLTIETSATNTRFGNHKAYIVVFNRDTCASCRTKAMDYAVKAKKTGNWDYIFIQDKVKSNVETL